jgi:hypothetical protein
MNIILKRAIHVIALFVLVIGNNQKRGDQPMASAPFFPDEAPLIPFKYGAEYRHSVFQEVISFLFFDSGVNVRNLL